MKLYELTYLISADFSEEELKTFQEKINSLIESEDGKIEKFKTPIKKRLEYPIGKIEKAYLIITDFYLEPEKLANLEKKLKKEGAILRYLILTKKKIPEIKIPKIIPKVKAKKPRKEKKVELEKIGEKLDEILGEL